MNGEPELVGRERELGLIRSWVEDPAVWPAALVVRGDAGIGKTSLWQAAVDRAHAQGLLVLVSRAIQAEMPLGYAALGDLFESVETSVLNRLPDPLARDLEAALLRREARQPSTPLTVARATLEAFRMLADTCPVLVAVDDVQWLDPASARVLAFAARRLRRQPVGFAVSLRDGHEDPLACHEAFGASVLELPVKGLTLGATGRLLRTRVDPQTTRRAVARVHERSAGNPFFALHLANAPADEPLPESLREVISTQLLLASPAAAEAIELSAIRGPSPTRTYTNPSSLAAAIEEGVLVERHGEVRFTHPLLAAAAYQQIGEVRRRALHREAADKADGIETRARHLALATDDPSSTTANLLDTAAATAASRGAPEAACELMVHAVRLTPAGDIPARLRRMTDLADDLVLSADEPAALAIVEQVVNEGASGNVLVRALVHCALLSSDAPTAIACLERATREPIEDDRLAAKTLAKLAWQRGAWGGDLDLALTEVTTAVTWAERANDDDALSATLTTAGLLEAFAGDDRSEVHFQRALAYASRVVPAAGDPTPRLAYAHILWWRADWEQAVALLAAERRDAEDRGDDGRLMRLDVFGAELAVRRGRWTEADELITSALGDARGYWRVMALLQRSVLRARRDEDGAVADAAEVAASAFGRSEPVIAAAADFALGLIASASGDVASAADLLVRLPLAVESAPARALEFAWAAPEAVAALVAADRVTEATWVASRLGPPAEQLGCYGESLVAHCQGLVALGSGETDLALTLMVTAREGFDLTLAPWELGQSLLAEGAALRRLGRRRDAASALERAASTFAALGAGPAERRATQELARARPRPRNDDEPTAAERRVAGLVAEGLTNKEVAARLSTSVATVEAHLTRLYAKVGVRSRTQLARLVAEGRLDVDPSQV